MPRLKFPWKPRPKVESEEDLVSAYGVLMPHKTKRDLKYISLSTAIGIAFVTITGFPAANPILTAFYKDELHMSDSMIGLIMALPQLAVLIQVPFSLWFRRSKGMRWLYLLPSFIVRLSFVVMSFLAFLVGSGALVMSRASYIVLGVMSIASIAQWVADLSLNTWLGLTIPYPCRGRYLTSRQTYSTLATIFFTLVLILVSAPLSNSKYQYVLYFFFAALFGFIELILFLPVSVPSQETSFSPEQEEKERNQKPPFRDLLSPYSDKNYRTYLAFVLLWYFGVGIPQPYFNVHMNDYLKLSLGLQNLLGIGVKSVGTVLFAKGMGRLSDRYGNRSVLLLSASVATFLPVIYLFVCPTRLYLIGLVNFLSGIFFVGVDMNVYTMSIFLAPEDKRPNYLVAKGITQAILATVPGVLIGGQLMQHLEEPLARLNWTFFGGQPVIPFQVTLSLSFLFRGLATFIFARRIRPAEDDEGYRAFLREQAKTLFFKAKYFRKRLHILWFYLKRRIRRINH